MSKNIAIGVLIIAVLGLSAWIMLSPQGGQSGRESLVETGSPGEEYYTCPMHPSVRSDRPGACPVCGMALVKKSAEQAEGTNPESIRGISLSPAQRVMANISTVSVERKTLKRELTAVGVVDFAEPSYLHISMRFAGRLEKLYLTYTGQTVRKGDPVADVYSPEAISAQQEYLIALESWEQLKDASEDAAAGALDLRNQGKEKLLRWGFSAEQVGELEETREIAQTITMLSPISGTVMKKNVDPQHYAAMGEDIYDVADLSTVWIYLDMYEKDIRFVRIGQGVRITTEAYPHEQFTGKVTFIDPVLNADTRTVRVRTECANPAGKLKPNMFVKAAIAVPSTNTLVIPASAIMSTGRRNIVWVEVETNRFEPRDVVSGVSTETYAEIVSGLSEGEHVASTGGFLIDSESELQRPGEPDAHAGHTDMQPGGKPDAKPDGNPPGQADAAEPAGDPVAGPSGYFAEAEKEAVNNEAAILVKGTYSPHVIRVKVGKPVTLRFYRDEDADCTNEVVFESLGIRRRLPARETTTIVFTPADTGEIAFSCGMGMIRGKVVVEE